MASTVFGGGSAGLFGAVFVRRTWERHGRIPLHSAEELIEKAKVQRQRGRVEESIVSARQAINLDPEDPDAHWQLALSLLAQGADSKALQSLDRVVELAPRFAGGWACLGKTLLKVGNKPKAKACLERAIGLDAEQIDVQTHLAKLYEEDKQPDKELEALSALEAASELTYSQAVRLGILFHNKKEYFRAIHFYKIGARGAPGAVVYFNLGLALNAPEVSQDVDAIDAWRRSLEINSEYDRPRERIGAVVPHLVKLREKVRTEGSSLLDEGQWFANYLNPLRLLNFSAGDQPDTKAIQKARGALLREIELEDGKVEWLRGLQIDRSRAIGLCDELNDDVLVGHHRRVLENSNLCDFLHRGSLDHFLIDEEASPIEMIRAIEEDDEGFAQWLSPRFAAQFDLVLSKAIESRKLGALESLLDGRRWVVPTDEDRCFVSAHRDIDRLLEPLRKAAELSEVRKPSLKDIEALLSRDSMGQILGLMPMMFYKEQQEAANLVRGISIDAHNHHGDSSTAKDILKLANAFALRSPSLKIRISDDLKTLDEQIAAQKQDEALLTFGKKKLEITREGARFGERWIPLADVESLRWGTIVDVGQKLTFVFAVSGSRPPDIAVEWTAANEGQEAQRKHFEKLVNASISYLLPEIIGKLISRLESGTRIQMGSIHLTRDGIEATQSGAFFNRTTVYPWSSVSSAIANGAVVLSVANEVFGSVDLHTTPNAVALHFLIQAGRYPEATAQSPQQPVRSREFSWGLAGRHVLRHWFWYLILGGMAWGMLDSRNNSVAPSSQYSESSLPRPSAPVSRYQRPLSDPNGKPWPSYASYLTGFPRLNTDGYSSVTVDNSSNDSDVMVKLVSSGGNTVRTFFIPAHRSFTVENVRQGTYDIRYRDLDSGALSRSEPFTLEEVETYEGVQYSQLTMTLYKVRNGNMQTYGISESDF